MDDGGIDHLGAWWHEDVIDLGLVVRSGEPMHGARFLEWCIRVFAAPGVGQFQRVLGDRQNSRIVFRGIEITCEQRGACWSAVSHALQHQCNALLLPETRGPSAYCRNG